MRRPFLAAAALAVLQPGAALACPACYAALAPRLLATYYVSTAFLSLLPFAIVATLLTVARRLQRRFRGPGADVWSSPR